MPRRKKDSSENTRLSSSTSINKDKKIVANQRNAANSRERARMRVLSRAFCRLKTTLPWVPADTKLSKLDTLRLASSYIAHLKGILRDETFSAEEPVHPAMSLTWPFGFNRNGGGNGSVGGGSGSEGESGSSCAWEEVAKDCVHLEHDIQIDPPHNSSSYSSSSSCNPSNNTSILSSNNSSPLFHITHHHSALPNCFHDNQLLSIG